jgi:hypothetical protein
MSCLNALAITKSDKNFSPDIASGNTQPYKILLTLFTTFSTNYQNSYNGH